ncbi:MAG: response regulator [Chloroflexota bacterium]
MRAICEVEPTSELHVARGMAATGVASRPEAARIRVLLVDDHTLLRQGLASLVRARVGMQVVGEAGNGRDAVQMAELLRPDVVLMDMAMPDMNGLEATREISRRLPGTHVIILGSPAYADQLAPIVCAGAVGYLFKDTDAEELFIAVEAVARGNAYFGLEISTSLVRRGFPMRHGAGAAHQPLTSREREILDLVAEGYPNQEIGQQLCVSVKTVEAHKAHIIAKLGLRGALDLMKYAVRRQMTALGA